MLTKHTKYALIAAIALALGDTAQGAKIGLNFQGRTSVNDTSAPALAATQSAGVVPQTHWNNFDNFVNGTSATDVPLNDDTGAATPITISFTANDSWNDDAPTPTATSTGDQVLTFGEIKEGTAGSTATFTYSGVPAGSTGFYDLYVYTCSNNDGVRLNTAVGNQKYYTIGEHTWSGTYKRATNNVDPQFGFTADVGNYIKFSGLQPDLSGSIALTATYVSGGDGLGISALQLVDGSSAVVDTTPPFVLLTQNPAGFTKIILTFSEILDPSAADKSHFTISPAVTISDASFVDPVAANQIVLTTSAQTPATLYTVSFSGIKDAVGNAGASTAKFTTPAIASGDIKGFNNGTNFTVNGGATIAGGTATLTTAVGNEAHSLFFNQVVDASKFNVQFTYRATAGADGSSFTLQAAPAGTTAVGGGGGALALVTPSVAVLFNIYVPNTIGTRVSTDGTSGGYTDTAPLNLAANHPIFVTLSYNGTTLHTKLLDGTTGDLFEADDAVDLVSILGSKYAYAGFTGATGGANALQTVSDFIYSNNSITAAPVTITTQPKSQHVVTNSVATFVVDTSGPATFQWFKGSTAIAGATSAQLAVGPVALSDNNTKYHVVVTGLSGGAAITSADATLTVDALVFVNGFLTDEVYFGFVKADVEGDLTLLPTPTTVYRTSFQTPEGTGDNYAERVYGYFIPKASGTYTFYVYSDDDSDLWLSTDSSPDNKVIIASETSWSNINEWVTIAGGTDTTAGTAKTSDTLFPDGITLVAGTKYYIEEDHHEGGGGDHLGVYYNTHGDPAPADGTAVNILSDQIATLVLANQTISISKQPASVTNNTGSAATFTITVDNTGAGIQWQRNGQNIAGATGASYTTPLLLLSDNGAKYHAVVTIPGASLTSADATLTVLPGTTPAKVVSANGLSATEIGVGFDKIIDPASAVVANFTVTGGGVISAVKAYSIPDPIIAGKASGAVKLTLSTPVTGSSVTVTVTGVKDLDGLTVSGSATAKINKLVSVDIGTAGDPINPGDAVSTADGSFDVYAGGSDIYNNADGFHFVYEAVTGDFDVSANVEYVLPVDNWSAGAVMVRETLDAGSVQIHIKQTPPSTSATVDGATGANSFEDNWRAVTGGAVAGGWGDNTGDRSAPTYPNAWIRIARVGDTLTGYRSLDGITWNEFTQMDLTTLVDADGNPAPFPANSYVGLATTSHNNSVGAQYITTVNYRGVKIIGTPTATTGGGPVSSKITVVKNANKSITISWDKAGKLQSTSQLQTTGTVWTDVAAGGTSPVTLTPAATGNVFYRVLAQ